MELMTHSSTFLLPSPPADDGPALKYALVILNRPLPRFTPLLWKHDGGANRLYDELPQLFPEEEALAIRKRYKPDLIKGDMDSIREEVLQFYKNAGTEVVDASQDQDTTDLHKCVAYVQDLPKLKNQNLCILAAGALGGRFDHEVGNINVLCRFPSMRIILLSDNCLIQLLPCSHRHEMRVLSDYEGPHCGLVPIGEPSKSTTTTGLQWNLSEYSIVFVNRMNYRAFPPKSLLYVRGRAFVSYSLFNLDLDPSVVISANAEMRFGGLISTSNIVKGEIVTVQSDTDLLWTISIKKA
ncbi:hypothetical protein RD792_009333, partial [Penstemon davidsonii]